MTTKRAGKATQPGPKIVSAAQIQSGVVAPTSAPAALVERVVALIEKARSRVARTVNSEVLSN